MHLLPFRIRKHLYKPPFRVYGVGTAKSGTHSLWKIFSQYPAAHEAQSYQLRQLLIRRWSGKNVDGLLRTYFRRQHRQIRFAVYISHIQSFCVPEILRAVPQSKIILTIRDPYTWLDSMLNHLTYDQVSGVDSLWESYWNKILSTPQPRSEDLALTLYDTLCYSLDAYLIHWRTINEKIITETPPDRLLILRTDQLADSLGQIADFLGIKESQLDPTCTHDFRAHIKLDLLRQVDQEFLNQKVREHCGELMDRFFPEITSISDTKLWADGDVFSSGSVR